MFTFQAWRPAAHVGEPSPLAAAFTDAYNRLGLGSFAETDIRFEIVDVRPGIYGAQQVHAFVQRLAKLLLGDAADARSFSPESRLLFVGSVRTLATREPETVDKRSIKLDAEFYIRALQNYGLAHYAGIGEETAGGDGAGPSIRSALIGITRHYREPRRGPAAIRFGERIAQIRSDLVHLSSSARNLPEFRFLGSSDGPDFSADRVDHLRLMLEIGVIYQFGKGDRPLPFSPTVMLTDLRKQGLSTFDVDVEDSSYDLYAGTLAQMGSWAESFHAGAVSSDARDKKAFIKQQHAAADQVAKRSFKLSRYDLLRDFGRVIGQGTLPRLREISPSRPVLLIDDEVHGILAAQKSIMRLLDTRQDPIIRYLGHALGSAGWTPSSVHVVPSEYVDAHIGLMQATGLTQLLRSPDSIQALDLEGVPAALCPQLDQYLAILIDPESRKDPCGPVRVQRLHGYLKQRFAPVPGAEPSASPRQLLPPLLAYSRKESSGYVQQCLNMGASAFVPKTRPFQLLFAMSRALRDERRQHRPSGEASQFRILETLKPHIAAKLLRKSGPSFIHGGLTLSPVSHVADPREERWIRNLPKADLHYHLGTAIPCATIEVLAMNTAGHFLTGAPDPSGDDSGDSGASPLLRRLADTLAVTALLERRFMLGEGQAPFSRMELLAAAAAAVVPSRQLKDSSFGLGDAVIAHLVETNDRCDASHATAMLVAMMVSGQKFKINVQLTDFFEELDRLAQLAPVWTRATAEEEIGKVSFTPKSALFIEMRRAYNHFNRVSCRWNGSCTKDDFVALSNTASGKFWASLRGMIEERVKRANSRLHSCLKAAQVRAASDAAVYRAAVAWLAKNSQSEHLRNPKLGDDEHCVQQAGEFSIEDYVAVPEVEQGRGLQLYLRGADLLGSSHLQYPENLWIAALAITSDNAHDNVVYSEVRCETTGFCKAGMGAHDATELLRHGFNLASLYFAGLPKPGDPRHALPLVRTNILLAAKRHKTESEARAVVNLLETYLERRAAVADGARSRRDYSDTFGCTMPPWWRPCDVVGFDLSGDETRDKDWLKTVIVPLASRSSPVTIHAGEAASAESIWRAVYELNALRIGHGLRLSEDTALLSYCVREGICMEFCPNSNRYTNQLHPQKRRDLDMDQPIAPLRYEYPLIYYLSQGMEVTLGTDNRYLHRDGQRTLTSEYLTAAELVGGLTRWEVLQIVKAGFKNAFLSKAEVQLLIESVEGEIYRIVATDFE